MTRRPRLAPTRRLILGIDPGVHGALVVIDPAATVRTPAGAPELAVARCLDVPLAGTGPAGRDRIDELELAAWLDVWAPDLDLAVLEDAGARPSDGAAQAFAFGRGIGVMVGLLAAAGVQIHPVKPSVWKSCFGLSADKAESLLMAKRLAPAHAQLFKRKKDADRAEALILAYWGLTRVVDVRQRVAESCV